MEKLKTRFIVLICLLAATGVIVRVHSFLYAVQKPKQNLSIPLKIGQWVGQEGTVSEEVYNILEADSVIIRKYFK